MYRGLKGGWMSLLLDTCKAGPRPLSFKLRKDTDWSGLVATNEKQFWSDLIRIALDGRFLQNSYMHHQVWCCWIVSCCQLTGLILKYMTGKHFCGVNYKPLDENMHQTSSYFTQPSFITLSECVFVQTRETWNPMESTSPIMEHVWTTTLDQSCGGSLELTDSMLSISSSIKVSCWNADLKSAASVGESSLLQCRVHVVKMSLFPPLRNTHGPMWLPDPSSVPASNQRQPAPQGMEVVQPWSSHYHNYLQEPK